MAILAILGDSVTFRPIQNMGRLGLNPCKGGPEGDKGDESAEGDDSGDYCAR